MRHPWLNKSLHNLKAIEESIDTVGKLINRLQLHTVCEEASCPNIIECFSNHTATFMIMGKYCTRNCGFCDVIHGKPEIIDDEEPMRLAKAAEELKLKHVVITSVTRDDLADFGASYFARTIGILKDSLKISIEVLIPDFKGNLNAIKTVVDAHPDIIGHNMETVKGLYKTVKPQANYMRSLSVLKIVKYLDPGIIVKSGMMVGLGEQRHEVEETMKDVQETGCNVFTIGQYLSPGKVYLPVKEYLTPEQFKKYEKIGYESGFDYVVASPYTRSSYNAKMAFDAVGIKNTGVVY